MRFVLILFLCLLSGVPALAFEPSTTGVVLLHGKWGKPEQMKPVQQSLSAAGFAVVAPAMPWSATRLYDRSFDQAMDEIDTALAGLRANGAKRVVVVGQSMGANAAWNYATLGRGVAAVVLIAPGHLPDLGHLRDSAASDVALARQFIAAGEGGKILSVTDYNTGNRTRTLPMSAQVFLSYFAPDGFAAMGERAAQIKDQPVVWLAPKQDPVTRIFAEQVVPKLPAGIVFIRQDLESDHLGAPTAAADPLLRWLLAQAD